MTPYEFIRKWQGSTLNERQSYQAHFTDLCALVGVAAPSPATADSYCFERGVAKTGKHSPVPAAWVFGGGHMLRCDGDFAKCQIPAEKFDDQ